CRAARTDPQEPRRSSPCGVHALVKRLDHEVIAITVDDQRRQPVAFTVDHAVGIGVAHHLLPVVIGFGEAPGEKLAADFLHFGREQTQADLRRGAVMRHADGSALMIYNFDDCPWSRVVALDYVARENPRVTGTHAAGSLAIHFDLSHRDDPAC